MKTSFGWFFLLLSHVSAYRFLEESCGTWPTYKPTNVAWLANIWNDTHFQCHGTLIHRRFVLTAARCIHLPGMNIGSHVEFGSAKYNVSILVAHKDYLQNDIGLLKLSRNVDFNGFVITNAQNLPEDASSLDVGLAETPRSYDEFRVLSIFKHPEFSQYYKNDIALLKLNRPVTFDKMSPVCMLALKNHQEQAESALFLTIFHYAQTENHITIVEKNVTLIDPLQCSNKVRNIIDQNQVCVQASQGMSYGNPGDILIKKIMYLGKEWIVLVGIVSYSSNGIQVFTNVMRHTDWITEIVTSNQ
ncbi:serine protease grass isoform X3 [Drosophila suzukii]|uniref:Serine protease grass isoform X3 n=1 Tax=Drosophila suzukii TaxID=28584 RepID=A0ABM4TL33_DROSZ